MPTTFSTSREIAEVLSLSAESIRDEVCDHSVVHVQLKPRANIYLQARHQSVKSPSLHQNSQKQEKKPCSGSKTSFLCCFYQLESNVKANQSKARKVRTDNCPFTTLGTDFKPYETFSQTATTAIRRRLEPLYT